VELLQRISMRRSEPHIEVEVEIVCVRQGSDVPISQLLH
jgi:hypothetical protein